MVLYFSKMSEHYELGKKGEQLAVDYLTKEGYKIEERNWRFQKAEIDIIASKQETVISVEVKTRSSRDFETVNAGISTFNLGNFAFITNIYGSPDITFISGEADAFKKIQLYDDVTSTRGSASGNLIGIARSRAIEFSTGTAGATSSNTSSVYKL